MGFGDDDDDDGDTVGDLPATKGFQKSGKPVNVKVRYLINILGPLIYRIV